MRNITKKLVKAWFYLSYLRRFSRSLKFTTFNEKSLTKLYGSLRFVRVNYIQLYSLLLGKILLRNYSVFLKYKFKKRVIFLKQIKFPFVFGFIKFFFTKAFKFFSNFVVLHKYSFWVDGNFVGFVNNFSTMSYNNTLSVHIGLGSNVAANGGLLSAITNRFSLLLRSPKRFTCSESYNLFQTNVFALTSCVTRFSQTHLNFDSEWVRFFLATNTLMV